MLEMYGCHGSVLFHAMSVIVYGVPEGGANCGVARSRQVVYGEGEGEDRCVPHILTSLRTPCVHIAPGLGSSLGLRLNWGANITLREVGLRSCYKLCIGLSFRSEISRCMPLFPVSF